MKLFAKTTQAIRTTALFATVLATTLIGGGAFFSAAAQADNLSFNTVTDCNANAVINCGAVTTAQLISRYNNGTSTNTAKSIHDIYGSFGISSTAIQGIGSTAVAGTVSKSGAVYINGTAAAVATNAMTAGRQNMAGSTAMSFNGTTFYKRAPSVSFQSNSLAAFVVMKNGTFQYAILAACGNPVTATPTPKPTPTPTPTPKPTPKVPSYTLNKEVAVKGSAIYSKDVTVDAGGHVVYRITVKSTGTAPVTNLVVNDVLPSHVTYVSNTLTRDGTTVAGTGFFGTGVTVSSLAAGATTVFQFEAIVGADDLTTCTAASLNNVSNTTATSLPGNSSSANVNEQCVTVPVCTDLDITKGDNRLVTVSQFTFAAHGATFKNAVINWGDNTATLPLPDANSVVGQKHSFAADQNYTVSVAITFTQNGKDVVATGANCEKPVSFTTTPPATPAATILVDTGAGSVIGLFAATSAIGAMAYRWFLGRRLSGQV
jgi:uncharacterized repeat protein (TIGR01451 family)